MKTIGIIGGMGPEATLDLFGKIIQQTKVSKDQDHVHVIIDNDTSIPDRSHYILTGEDNPYPRMLEAANRLSTLNVDYIAIPCNTAHFFYQKLQSDISISIIHMIEETYHYIVKRNMKTVLLLATLGTYASNLYGPFFENACLLEPNDILKESIHKIIYDYKKNGSVKETDLHEINTHLDALPVDGIILGCTELPMIFKGPKFIDPTMILAQACITKSGHQLKN